MRHFVSSPRCCSWSPSIEAWPPMPGAWHDPPQPSPMTGSPAAPARPATPMPCRAPTDFGQVGWDSQATARTEASGVSRLPTQRVATPLHPVVRLRHFGRIRAAQRSWDVPTPLPEYGPRRTELFGSGKGPQVPRSTAYGSPGACPERCSPSHRCPLPRTWPAG